MDDQSATESLYVPSSEQKESEVCSTKVFMESIDLRCEDHLSHYHKDIPATRYCSLCKHLCCDNCVIEFHHDHIDCARIQIDEFCHKKRLDLVELKSGIDHELKMKVNENEIDKIIDSHNKSIETFFKRRINTYEEMKNNIEQLIKEEENTKDKMKKCVETFYKEEGYKRMQRLLDENIVLGEKIKNFLSDWDGLSKKDKVEQLKSGVVDEYLQEGEKIKEVLMKVTEEFQGKANTMNVKINDVFKKMEFPEKINDVDDVVGMIRKTMMECQQMIAQLEYDEVVVEQVEDLSKMRKDIGERLREMQMRQQQQQQQNTGAFKENANEFRIMSESNNNIQGNNNGIGGEFTFVKQSNAGGFQQQQQQSSLQKQQQQQQQQSFGQIPQFGNQQQQPTFPPQQQFIPPPQQQQQFIPPPQQQPQFNYEYFISLKPRSNDLTIYSPDLSFQLSTLSPNSFRDPSDVFYQIPDHSKYVNIGSSLLLTGGYINKQPTSKCYLICLTKNASSFDPMVLPYTPMNENRERHNIIFLPNRKIVLVASGFFNKSSEYTNIDQGNWISSGNLIQQRGNATTAYVNNRYIYIIGGYKLNQGSGGGGSYLGDAEYLDMDNVSRGWTLINFKEFPLELSAMGVISLANNKIILCGGFDGKTYRQESYVLEVKDNMVNDPTLIKSDLMLPGNYIFLHNNFILTGNVWYNFELSGNAVMYSVYENKFSTSSPI